MKPLLLKTTTPYLVYVLIILILSIPVYHVVIEKIWVGELDEHNRAMAERTEEIFNHLNLPDSIILDKVNFWNNIESGVLIQKKTDNIVTKDSIFTTNGNSPYVQQKSDDNFRVLLTTIRINREVYSFRSATSYEDTHETVTAIAVITILFFAIILIGIIVLSRILSRTIWRPFRSTLDKLKNFNINNEAVIHFEKSDTTEFEELNQSLRELIEHNVAAYNTQKEFTENASHELQTPLAILKNKLDLLLQNEDLTEKQYQIAEDMNKALSRSARINQNLLLLAKIDNRQYDKSEECNMSELVQQSIDTLQEHFDQKNIATSSTIQALVIHSGNSSLTEILINNLLVNAIRHTTQGGTINITLNKSELEVQNSGERPLNAALLFKRFSKLSTENNGSGLGLAIINQICKLQHWTISYKYNENKHVFSVKF